MLERGKMDRDVVEIVGIDSLVPKEHLLRKIDKAVDFSRLYEMVEPLYCEDNGRPSVDPVVLFKMVLIQHLYGLPSLRRTAEEVSGSIYYRWFLGYTLQEETPHFSTVSYNFRHRFTEETVDRVFRWILDEVAEAGYLSPKAVFIDGTHRLLLLGSLRLFGSRRNFLTRIFLSRLLPLRHILLISLDVHALALSLPRHAKVKVLSDVAQLVVVVVVDVIACVMYLSAVAVHGSRGVFRSLVSRRDRTQLATYSGIGLIIRQGDVAGCLIPGYLELRVSTRQDGSYIAELEIVVVVDLISSYVGTFAVDVDLVCRGFSYCIGF